MYSNFYITIDLIKSQDIVLSVIEKIILTKIPFMSNLDNKMSKSILICDVDTYYNLK